MSARDTTGYNNQSKQSLAGAKLVAVGEINAITSSGNAPICATATPQEIMYSPTGNFGNQGGASWDAIITPFQINGGSSKLPTMPTTASSGCVPSQANQIDPPVSGYTTPVINVSYLNPFKRPSDPSHGTASNYDGTIIFNGGGETNQNLINSSGFPEDLRPMALRGPLVIQGWGYDLNGKPIPNKADSAGAAQSGTFVSSSLQDTFLDNWIQKRETWPVAPVDLRYDRLRKVWTIPNGFRIIQASGNISSGVGEATALNMGTVYDGSGSGVSDAKIQVTVPSWHDGVSGSFFTFYDTRDCTYYPLTAGSGGGSGVGTCIEINRQEGCSGVSHDSSGAYSKYNSLRIGAGLKGTPYSRTIIGSCSDDAMSISTIHKFGGSTFTNIVIGSGLELSQTSGQSGTCNYTLNATSGGSGGGCAHAGTANVSYVADINCAGSGLDISYGQMVFISGCFSGAVTS